MKQPISSVHSNQKSMRSRVPRPKPVMWRGVFSQIKHEQRLGRWIVVLLDSWIWYIYIHVYIWIYIHIYICIYIYICTSHKWFAQHVLAVSLIPFALCSFYPTIHISESPIYFCQLFRLYLHFTSSSKNPMDSMVNIPWLRSSRGANAAIPSDPRPGL